MQQNCYKTLFSIYSVEPGIFWKPPRRDLYLWDVKHILFYTKKRKGKIKRKKIMGIMMEKRGRGDNRSGNRQLNNSAKNVRYNNIRSKYLSIHKWNIYFPDEWKERIAADSIHQTRVLVTRNNRTDIAMNWCGNKRLSRRLLCWVLTSCTGHSSRIQYVHWVCPHHITHYHRLEEGAQATYCNNCPGHAPCKKERYANKTN